MSKETTQPTATDRDDAVAGAAVAVIDAAVDVFWLHAVIEFVFGLIG